MWRFSFVKISFCHRNFSRLNNSLAAECKRGKLLFLVQSNDCNLILIYICTNILELSVSWEAWNWKWNFTVCSKQPFILKYVFQTCKKCVSIGPFVCTLLSIIFRLLHSALYKSYVYKYCKKKTKVFHVIQMWFPDKHERSQG